MLNKTREGRKREKRNVEVKLIENSYCLYPTIQTITLKVDDLRIN